MTKGTAITDNDLKTFNATLEAWMNNTNSGKFTAFGYTVQPLNVSGTSVPRPDSFSPPPSPPPRPRANGIDQ